MTGQWNRRLRRLAIVVLCSLQWTSIAVGEDKCTLSADGLVRRSTLALQVTATFITKPRIGANTDEIKKHIIYSRILGRLAATRLAKSSSERCTFGAETNGLDLHFHLFSGRTTHNECSLSLCARELSDVLRNTAIQLNAYSLAIDSIVKDLRSADGVDFRFPLLSARRAVLEAYRYIYSTGTVERIFSDLSAEDFSEKKYDEFVAWVDRQRIDLRKTAQSASSHAEFEISPAPVDMGSACVSKPEVKLKDLNVDHHGWGQLSLLMIRNAHKKDGADGIENTALRTFCDPNKKGADNAADSPWREMSGRVRCFRQTFNQDKWLILFGETEPQTLANMRRNAQSIADVLKRDTCVDPRLEIFVVNFSQTR